MNKDGKTTNCIINILDRTLLDVWADEGLMYKFKQIPGVTSVFTQNSPTNYLISLDPRYLLLIVAENIRKIANG
jgi:hypothetical protein